MSRACSPTRSWTTTRPIARRRACASGSSGCATSCASWPRPTKATKPQSSLRLTSSLGFAGATHSSKVRSGIRDSRVRAHPVDRSGVPGSKTRHPANPDFAWSRNDTGELWLIEIRDRRVYRTFECVARERREHEVRGRAMLGPGGQGDVHGERGVEHDEAAEPAAADLGDVIDPLAHAAQR